MTRLLHSRLRRSVAIISVGAGAALLAGWSAPFHLHLLKSLPAANATVKSAPDSIRLWFSQTPELGVTSVKVKGPGAAVVTLAPLAKRDSSLVVAPVKGKMAAGAYTVAWRTMAKDGHVASGSFGFKIGAGK